MIQVKNISFSYADNKKNKEKLILVNINFKIKKSEFVSILGPSGCGKTTLVNILAGYLELKNGEILINKKIVKTPGKNRIVVNQENDLFAWQSVLGNMQMVCSNKSEIEQKLELVGLGESKNLYPSSLSGGMKKRISLARALAPSPEFLILDEPFASLDHKMREELQMQLDRVFFLTKKTTLLVTHDIDEAIFLSDRIIVLGKNPAKIINELEINFPHPRKNSIKTTRKFISLKKQIKKTFN